MVEKLRPYVIVLPSGETTKINVNTAPAEVLAALIPNYSVMQANSLVEQRKRAPFLNVGMFAGQVNMANAPDLADVKSDWFLVRSRIRLDRAALNAEALVSRGGRGSPLFTNPEVKWIRQN
jgi:general secretion pathway protein K